MEEDAWFGRGRRLRRQVQKRMHIMGKEGGDRRRGRVWRIRQGVDERARFKMRPGLEDEAGFGR